MDFPTVARDNEPVLQRGIDPEVKVEQDSVRGANHAVSPLAMEPMVPFERRYIFAGTADRMARPDQARALWRHWGRCRIHWFSGGHIAAQWNSSVAEFVDEALRESFSA